MLNGLARRAVMTVLGVLVTLAWWSFRGGDSNSTQVDKIPATVFGGGGGKVTIEVQTTCAARFSMSFSGNEDDSRSMDAVEVVEPGTHSWTIDVPRGVGGYVDFTAVEPKVCDRLSWRLLANGQIADEQFDELKEPLQSGYAFGLTAAFDDYSTGEYASD
jgi:hypothetical protein